MELITFKIFSAVALFLAAIVAGLIPLIVGDRHPRALCLFEAGASGVFLGAALFHMLPASQQAFKALNMAPYPYAILFCVIGFLFLLVTERVVNAFADRMHAHRLTALLLLVMLSFHSLIEGAALGINSLFNNAMIIFIAIMSHKSTAAFALGVTILRGYTSKIRSISMLIGFSLMTPIGVVLAALVSGFLHSSGGNLAEAIFNAFAAGSFLYIGSLNVIDNHFHAKPLIDRAAELSSLIIGIASMGVIAIWV
jgi:zinc transporter 1/2/3